MKRRRIWTYLASGALILTTLALQGCFEAPVAPAYGYGYGYNSPAVYPEGPVYGSPPPVVIYGDYDDYHRWHDRDWWVDNQRPWVEQHHREWLTARPAPHQLYGHHEGHERD
jgi:hypothetical protein